MKLWQGRWALELSRHAGKPSIHMIVDSSPKGGFDWENTELHWVPAGEAGRWLLRYHCMMLEAEQSRDSRDPVDHQEERDSILMMSEITRVHHCPPVALATGRSDRFHKTQGL